MTHQQASSSVPLDDIAELTERLGVSVEREPNGLSIQGMLGTTRLQVRPSNHSGSPVGRVAEIVTIHTDLPEFPLGGDGEDERLSTINRHAATSALVAMRRGEVVRLVSRLSIFEDDHQCWRLYTPLLVFGMRFQSELFDRTIVDLLKPPGVPQYEPLYASGEQSRWYGDEIDTAKSALDRMGLFVNAEPDSLTCEFPWDEGAYSQMASLFGVETEGGGRTSLLRMTTEESHPSLGNGLLCRLTLPVSFPPDLAAEAACRLNLLELLGVDAPPFFGAWCAAPGTGDLTFVTFWPNAFYQEGSGANLAVWMLARTEVAKRWVKTDTVLRDLERQDAAGEPL